MTCDLVSGCTVLLLFPKLILVVLRSGHVRDVSNETLGIYAMMNLVKELKKSSQSLRMATLRTRLQKAEDLRPMLPPMPCPSKSAPRRQG